MRLRAEGVEHPSELNSDISGSNDDDSLGLLLNVKEPVRVDTVLCAGNVVIGRDGRSTADGDVEHLGFDSVRLAPVPRSDFDLVGRDELGPAFVVVDFVVDEVLLANL